MTNDNDIILELERRWVSREELSLMLNATDRNVRSWIESMNDKLMEQNKCILSTAARKGYHIPSFYSEEDVRLANLAEKEYYTKAVSLMERRKPIQNFIKFVASMEASKDNIQLTLF